MVSIIIRTYNEEKWIGECLRNVFSQKFNNNLECIIIDSDSTDRTVEIAKQFDVKIFNLPKDAFSFGKGINYGIEKSSGEYIVILSAHAIPLNKNWLYKLIRNFNDKKVAGVYGRQIPLPDCNPVDARDILKCYGLEKKIQTTEFFFSNANAAIRRSVWKEVPFDEKVPAAEDQLWAKEVITRGFKIIYEPEAIVMHSHNETLEQRYIRALREGIGLSKLRKGKIKFRRVILSTAYNTLLDWIFIIKNRYKPKWFLYSPIQRFIMAYGYYKGSNISRRERYDQKNSIYSS